MSNLSASIGRKRWIAVAAILCSVCAVLGVIGTMGGAPASQPRTARAEEIDPAQRYLYARQLDETAANLYDAMVAWHKAGGFIKGKGDIDLVAGKHVTQAQLKDYMNGDPSLAQAFQSARDAFIHDHEELFYLDSTKLTLRVGQIDGKMCAYINSGANENYYAADFTNEAQVKQAVADAQAKLLAIETAIRAQLDVEFPDAGSDVGKPGEGKITYAEDRIVTLAHNALIAALEYTYPSREMPHVGGVYALISGKANCVGYSSLFKSLMNGFGLPCVLVEGTAENAQGILEVHMWNYVRINTVWYAVDVTWDDPIKALKSDSVRDTYLLRGEIDFLSDHFESGIFSPGGKEFTYPDLNLRDFGDIVLETGVQNNFNISAAKSVWDDVLTTQIYFTYQHEGKFYDVFELEEMGLYVAGQFCYYGEEPQPWVPMHVYDLPKVEIYSMIPISKRGSIRFCVTDFNALTADGKQSTHYKEDLTLEGNHLDIADSFEIPYYSSYVPQPFIFTCEPSLTRKINAEETAFTVIYDDELVVDEGATFGATVLSSENIPGKLTDVHMEPTTIDKPWRKGMPATKVTFKFTPDNSYQSYINRYQIRLDNVKGKASNKAPNSVPVCVGFDMSIPCPSMVSAGYADNKAFVIGLPTLVVNPNADVFEYDGGEDVTALDIRLVATKPSDAKKGEFEDLTDETNILESSVYDLSLACQNYAARLKSDADYNLTVGIPYPEGYNFNSNADVQFKAYHYKKQADGSYVAEEIICRIGERGLEVVVDSFSPFLIVAVPKTEQAPSRKLVSAVSRTHGGDVLTTILDKDGNPVTVGSSGLYALSSGEQKTFTIQPKEGFVVDKVLLNSKLVDVSNNMVTFDYGTMADDNDLEVFFVAKTVKTEDTSKGFIPVVNTLKREALFLHVPSLPVKTTYDEGETFDPKGLIVRATYNDETVNVLDETEYTILGAENLTVGTHTITIALNGTTVKATFDIQVNKLPVIAPPINESPNMVILIVSIVGATLAVAALIVSFVYVSRKKRGR